MHLVNLDVCRRREKNIAAFWMQFLGLNMNGELGCWRAGVEHVSGNMFESVPSGGDAIFMKVWLLISTLPWTILIRCLAQFLQTTRL